MGLKTSHKTYLFKSLLQKFYRRDEASLKKLSSGDGRKSTEAYIGHGRNDRSYVRRLTTFGHETKRCRHIPEETQKLSFSDVNAKYHDKFRRRLAPFADMRSGLFGRIDAVKNRIDLAKTVAHFAPHPIDPNPAPKSAKIRR